MTAIVYSREPRELARGQKLQNPRFFTDADPKATKVFIAGDFPDIASAYEAAGVPVVLLDAVVEAKVKGPTAPKLKAETVAKIAAIGEAEG